MSVDLLSAEFVRELEVLRRRLEVRARSGRTGEHLAKRRGGSAEFHEHRAYEPGDDVRRIDWAAYARTDEPVLKLFRAEEDVVVRLVCDGSASLGCGAPPKIDVVKRFAAAIAYMTLARSERAHVLVADTGIRAETAPGRGRGALPSVLRALDAIAPAGSTDLATPVDAIVRRKGRPGMLVALTDFLDGGPVLEALGRAARAGHDLALVHVVAPDEMDPSFGDDGDVALEDVETHEVVELTLDADAIEAYALRFAGLCEELRAFCRKRRATYVRLRTDEPLEPAVRRFVARGID